MTTSPADLHNKFAQFKQAATTHAPPNLDTRKQLLAQLNTGLKQHKEALQQAASEDFGFRHAFDTTVGDVWQTVKGINYCQKHLKSWLKPSKRSAGMLMWPAKSQVHYMPKGVVGIMCPWNYPISLSLMPLAYALSAGNRAIVKLSEFTPQVNSILQQLITPELAEYVMLVEGDSQLAEQFSHLPWDHLFFTGSTAIGKRVMAAAATNLTPVTLELGGKSPVVVMPQCDVDFAAKRILMGKHLNGGQICIAPDYVWVHHSQKTALLSALEKQYSRLKTKQTHIINERQQQRLTNYLDDVKSQGGCVHQYFSKAEKQGDWGLKVITETKTTMQVMQEEIFGPILPLMSYQNLSDVASYINQQPSPLALYILGEDNEKNQQLGEKIKSGTLAINDTVRQIAVADAPFGGIGESGMGSYHGKEGFYTFSHGRNQLVLGKFNPSVKLMLHHKKWLQKMLSWLDLRP